MPKIKVSAKRDGYRRGGIAFSKDGVELDTAKLKKDQLEAIQSDASLKIVEIAKPETAAEKKAREEAEKKVREEAAKAGGAGGNDQGGKP